MGCSPDPGCVHHVFQGFSVMGGALAVEGFDHGCRVLGDDRVVSMPTE